MTADAPTLWEQASTVTLSMGVVMGIVLSLVVIAVIVIIWMYQRDNTNNIDVLDLVCHDGKIDEKKFTRFGAWLVSTWGFVYLILDRQFSEWYFAGYMTLWVGNVLVDKYLNGRDEHNGTGIPRKIPLSDSGDTSTAVPCSTDTHSIR